MAAVAAVNRGRRGWGEMQHAAALQAAAIWAVGVAYDSVIRSSQSYSTPARGELLMQPFNLHYTLSIVM